MRDRKERWSCKTYIIHVNNVLTGTIMYTELKNISNSQCHSHEQDKLPPN